MNNSIKNDLDIIKKKYGEKMMHLCRRLFPTILEQPGVLSNLILSHFEPSRELYYDIINNDIENEFKDYVYSLLTQPEIVKLNIKKSPKELLDEAGYILYECKTEEDVQSFRKYYRPFEEICTFGDKRINRCHVFFAVKKNVDEIKRENFPNPKRQDMYGTSVISIQFTRGKTNTLSIKNRYNDIVKDPDSTFYNNLDNIIPGLMASFAREYKFNYVSDGKSFRLNNYVQDENGKFYKYNYKINDIYYCNNNIIIDNSKVVYKYKEMEKYIIADYFIIDLVNKKIELYDTKVRDCFCDNFKNIKKINVIKDKYTENKSIEVFYENIKAIIVLDKDNRIIEYHNESITEVKNCFMRYNKVLNILNTPNLISLGNGFLYSNEALTNLNLLNLISVGNSFLRFNKNLSNLNTPNLVSAGNDFLYYNNALSKVALFKLKEVGNNFMNCNKIITSLEMFNLEKVGNNFFYYNNSITNLYMPLLKEIADGFLINNKQLISIYIPKLNLDNNKDDRINELILAMLSGGNYKKWTKN